MNIINLVRKNNKIKKIIKNRNNMFLFYSHLNFKIWYISKY